MYLITDTTLLTQRKSCRFYFDGNTVVLAGVFSPFWQWLNIYVSMCRLGDVIIFVEKLLLITLTELVLVSNSCYSKPSQTHFLKTTDRWLSLGKVRNPTCLGLWCGLVGCLACTKPRLYRQLDTHLNSSTREIEARERNSRSFTTTSQEFKESLD